MAGSGVDDRLKASYMRAELKQKVLDMKDDGLDVSHMDDILFMEEDDGLPSSVNIEYLLKNYNVHYDYRIFSHRKLLGPALIFGRNVVNGEINRSVLPLVSMQNQLNQITANVLKSHDSAIEDLHRRLSDIEANNEATKRKASVESVELPGQALVTQRIMEVSERLEEVMAAMGIEGDGSKAFSAVTGRQGESVSEAYGSAIGYFDGRKDVIDIGYGDGHFLSMAESRSITAYGIDVRREGPSLHLAGLQDAALDGAFMGYVIESMSQEYLAALIASLGSKLKPGAPLVILTADIGGLEEAYSDRIEAALMSGGFEVMERKWHRPAIPDSVKLQKVLVDSPSYNAREAIGRLNSAIDKLNERLFGGQDLILVSRRYA